MCIYIHSLCWHQIVRLTRRISVLKQNRPLSQYLKFKTIHCSRHLFFWWQSPDHLTCLKHNNNCPLISHKEVPTVCPSPPTVCLPPYCMSSPPTVCPTSILYVLATLLYVLASLLYVLAPLLYVLPPYCMYSPSTICLSPLKLWP